MAIGFTADEVLEMAGMIEARGAKFYRKAAKLHVAGRDLLQQIAQQEDEHFKTFSEMRKALTPAEKEPQRDPFGELELYLKAMVDGIKMEINKDPADAISGKESLQDIIKMAIGLEKDSIIFYLGLKPLVPPTFGKQRLDDIVRQEMTHIAWLSAKRSELS